MAEIALPSEVIITSLQLDIAYPGQQIYQSIYNGFTQRVVRGAGYWQGKVSFARTGQHGGDAQRKTQAFISSLRGIANTFRLPVAQSPGLNITDDLEVVGVAIDTNSDELNITLSGTDATSVPEGLYLTIGNRLYQTTTAEVSGSNVIASVIPQVSPTIGASASVNATVHCHRMTTNPVINTRGGDFAGGWTLDWKEVIE